MTEPRPTLRIDKWLWFARFFKTRGLAAKVITGGHVRVNGTKISKSSVSVGPGDTLTFAQGRDIRIIHVLDIGTRRGPAPEAQALYEDRTPPKPVDLPKEQYSKTPSYEGKGRPTKKDRRSLDLYRS
ncbi:UNVERIFIED_CONTAM: hypothetical protein GTU68_049167 [Idotea baltica]|nr:hypothetical protein [Idotea baltica]